MRELNAGDCLIPVRGGVVCRLFYYQEFGEEIEDALTTLAKGRYGLIRERLIKRGASDSDIDGITAGDVSVYERLGLSASELSEIIDESDIRDTALRVIWAMNKAERYAAGLSIPAFEQWGRLYAEFDVYAVIPDLNAEIYDAFHIKRSGENAKACGRADNLSAALIAVGKRLGFDLRELNEMSVQAFLDVLRAYAGGADGAELVREAEQKDIDWLLVTGERRPL